jgi:hypothetical protein
MVYIKPIRRIFKRHIKGELSQEVCEFTKEFIECILEDISKTCVAQMKKQNEFRKYHHLPPRKRLDIEMLKSAILVYLKVLSGHYKELNDFNCGKLGYTSSVTTNLLSTLEKYNVENC